MMAATDTHLSQVARAPRGFLRDGLWGQPSTLSMARGVCILGIGLAGLALQLGAWGQGMHVLRHMTAGAQLHEIDWSCFHPRAIIQAMGMCIFFGALLHLRPNLRLPLVQSWGSHTLGIFLWHGFVLWAGSWGYATRSEAFRPRPPRCGCLLRFAHSSQGHPKGCEPFKCAFTTDIFRHPSARRNT